ncbi:hypothetical protein KCU59_g148, partial [Aureobasidium melanogenum]
LVDAGGCDCDRVRTRDNNRVDQWSSLCCLPSANSERDCIVLDRPWWPMAIVPDQRSRYEDIVLNKMSGSFQPSGYSKNLFGHESIVESERTMAIRSRCGLYSPHEELFKTSATKERLQTAEVGQLALSSISQKLDIRVFGTSREQNAGLRRIAGSDSQGLDLAPMTTFVKDFCRVSYLDKLPNSIGSAAVNIQYLNLFGCVEYNELTTMEAPNYKMLEEELFGRSTQGRFLSLILRGSV